MNDCIRKISRYVFMAAVLQAIGLSALTARETRTDSIAPSSYADSLFTAAPLTMPETDSTAAEPTAADTLPVRRKRDWNTWRPDAKRAMWLAIVLPGAGQIYNRKYWKLPIFYGGFVGCIYALTWNGQMYHDYSQAYVDLMDNDPNTQSYNNFLHLGTAINESNKAHYQEIFRKRKDRYRKWRDMSVFALIGVYALSVIDAYVDASLSEFDISDDLSLHVSPAIINAGNPGNPVRTPAIGLGCSLNF